MRAIPVSIFSYEAGDYIQVTAQIDGETETKILCFAYEDHGNGNDAPIGLDADCNGTSDENRQHRLLPVLGLYGVDIPGTGDLLTLRIKVRVDAGSEEIAFDDIKVAGMAPAGTQVIPGTAGWRLLSLPKAGGMASDIADDTAIQGITGGTAADADPNLIIYDDTGVWEEPSDMDTPWGDGYGFALYFYDNTVAGSTKLPIILDAPGSEPSSDVSVLLNATVLSNGSYYTLLGNPFNSNFDVSTITATGDGMQNNVHFWGNGAKKGMGSYYPLDRTAPYIVSPWQGFWVAVTDGNSTSAVTFPTSGKNRCRCHRNFFLERSGEPGRY